MTTALVWRDILRTTAYNRYRKLGCRLEDYGPPGWLEEVAALAAQQPNKLSAINAIDFALREIEKPHVERREYERMWESEMCWPPLVEEDFR